MACKFQDRPFPPCHFEQHPYNNNIYYCPHCKDSYDVRDVPHQFPIWRLLVIGAIIFILMSLHSESSLKQQQKVHTRSHTTHTQ